MKVLLSLMFRISSNIYYPLYSKYMTNFLQLELLATKIAVQYMKCLRVETVKSQHISTRLFLYVLHPKRNRSRIMWAFYHILFK